VPANQRDTGAVGKPIGITCTFGDGLCGSFVWRHAREPSEPRDEGEFSARRNGSEHSGGEIETGRASAIERNHARARLLISTAGGVDRAVRCGDEARRIYDAGSKRQLIETRVSGRGLRWVLKQALPRRLPFCAECS
jgi:hypothetical protein